MKKNAFTLAELLVTLGIITIIAAVAAPLLNIAQPDKDKILYLKAYDTLTKEVKKLGENNSIYA